MVLAAAAAAPAATPAAGTPSRPQLLSKSTGIRAEAAACWQAQRIRHSRLSSRMRSQGSTAGRRSVRCPGFVGEGSRIAGEYHDADFEWEEVEEEGKAAVARQLSEWAERQAGQQAAPAEQHAGSSTSRNESGSSLASGSLASSSASSGTLLGGSSSSRSSSAGWEREGEAEGASQGEGASWERFHATHSQARFFKEKRYLMLEFPALGTEDPQQHIAEIGCGCGSALLPVLKTNPTCRVTGCDVSPTALALLRRAAEQTGIDGRRIHTFVLDASSLAPGADSNSVSSSGGGGSSGSVVGVHPSSSPSSSSSSNAVGAHLSSSPSGSPLAGLGADSLLLIFTLSALRPEEQPAALAHAYAALRPGGLLLFRDYGLYDMAQLRFPGSQLLGENLYRRSEGTLAYFFSTQALRTLALAAGFEEMECQYARVQLRNRKNGTAMRRVFVHGVFRKPAAAPATAA